MLITVGPASADLDQQAGEVFGMVLEHRRMELKSKPDAVAVAEFSVLLLSDCTELLPPTAGITVQVRELAAL